MRLTRTIFVSLLVALFTLSLVCSVYATPTYVTTLNGTIDGWLTHSARCWNGKGVIMSSYNGGAMGNPGPAPGYNVGFECTESSPPDGSPSQNWVGTNKYVGTKLSDIKKMEYWAIVDWRGINTFPLESAPGVNVPNEWRIQSQASQPPAILLTVSINGTDTRTLLYRPWSDVVAGFGPNAVEFSATGGARRHRIWQQYTAVDVANGVYEGLWYCTEALDLTDPTQPPAWGMYTWEQILVKYPDATLVTPTVVANPAFMADPVEAP